MTKQDGAHAARERIQRILLFAIGIGAIVFGALLLAGVKAEWDDLVPAFAWVSFLAGIAVPASFAVLVWVLPRRAMLTLAIITSCTFFIVQATWTLAMTVDTLGGAPWIQGITAVHTTTLAVAWPHRAVWIYSAMQLPLVGVTRYVAVGGDAEYAVLDGVGGMVFCIILMGAALALIGAANSQDRAAQSARENASIRASRVTREREQSRINAMVHDDIMSVLLAASRTNRPAQVMPQAERALTAIATLAHGDQGTTPYTVEELVKALRNTVSDLAIGVDFTADVRDPAGQVPRDVVAALTEALGEAIRNSILHAGRSDDEINRSVACTVAPHEVTVTVLDNGRGFNPRSIPQRRLGVRVSIIERMQALAGGDASIRSRIGQGTSVTLTWSRQ